MVWLIASREDTDTVERWLAYHDIEDVTVLLDEDGSVHRQYEMRMPFPTGAYPQQWLIDASGIVRHWANRYDHDELTTRIEELLAE